MDVDIVSSYGSSFSDSNGSFWNDEWCNDLDKSYIVTVIFLGIISVLGCMANIALLVITCLNKTLRTPSNIFLINVIAGDLIYICVRAPVFMRKLLFPMCWRAGLAACKVRFYFETVAQCVCILSLTALSIERYMAVVRGLESRQINSRNVKVIGVLVTWVLALTMAIPTALIAYMTPFMPICTTNMLGSVPGLLYDLYHFFSMYFIPLLVISILYTHIALTLYKSSHTMLSNGRQDANNRRQTSQRRRLAIIFVLITVSFAVFWLPYYIYNLHRQAQSFQGNDLPFSKTFEQISAISALLNACIDPFIVFAMSTVYRNKLSACCYCCEKQNNYCCEKSENINLNNHNRGGKDYHRPSITLFTSLKAPQSTLGALRRGSPSTVNTDTAL